jgi:adenosylcobyric acid synthase
VRVTFGADKVLARPSGIGYGAEVRGYEIHHGVAEVAEGRADPFPGGCRTVAVWGTTWHGTLECDQFRRAFLTEVAALAGRDFTVAPDTSFVAARQARLDTLADLVAEHLDTAAVSRLIEDGTPAGLPVVPPAGIV